MRLPVTISHTEYSMVHVPVRQALEEAAPGMPAITDAVLAAAVRAGATDEWRIMFRRIDMQDAPRVRNSYTSESECDAAFDDLTRVHYGP